VIQDVAAIGARARRAGAVMHTDAVQALGKMPFEFGALNVQAMTLSAHKIYGPKGAGALVVDKRLDLRALLSGGGQERGLRGGTRTCRRSSASAWPARSLQPASVNSPAARRAARSPRARPGRNGGGGVRGRRAASAEYLLFRVARIHGETLVIELDKAGYAVGSGAACSSADTAPSSTLLAMGVEPELARGAVRFSLGAANTAEQVDGFLQALAAVKRRLQQMKAMAV